MACTGGGTMCNAGANYRKMGWRRSALSASGRGGFTLVEIMIVVAILGILAGLSVPRALAGLSKAKCTTAEAQITILSGAIEFYRLDVRSYPPNLEAPLTAPGGVTDWDGPYPSSATRVREVHGPVVLWKGSSRVA